MAPKTPVPKKPSHFQICDKLKDKEGADIASFTNNVIEVKDSKRNTSVTLGCNSETAQKIMRMTFGGEKYYVQLLVIKVDEYEAVKKELSK